MALAVANHTASQTTSTLTTVTSTGFTSTSGNLLVVGVSGGNPGGTPITDTYSNTWVNAGVDFAMADGLKFQVWYAKNISGGTSHTVTWTVGTAHFINIGVLEISGADTSAPLDTATAVQENNVGPLTLTTAALSPAQANEIIVFWGTTGTGQSSQTLSDAGTTATTWTADNNITSGAGKPCLIGHSIVSATGSYRVTETISTATLFDVVTVAFKAVVTTPQESRFIYQAVNRAATY